MASTAFLLRANNATVSVRPKILQLDLGSEMYPAKYCLSRLIKSH